MYHDRAQIIVWFGHDNIGLQCIVHVLVCYTSALIILCTMIIKACSLTVECRTYIQCAIS